MQNVLPDLLKRDLRVVFCGTAAGTVSAESGSYYAHSHNNFWTILAETGLTPTRIRPHEFRTLLEHRIGLTDLVKDAHGNDGVVRRATNTDREALRDKLAQYKPTFLALTSKGAGRQFLGSKIDLGESEPIGSTRIFVLPSTSLQARWQWKEAVHHWQDFAKTVRES